MIANELVNFKKGMVENLIEEHGTDESSADKFIEWRFRHMQPGEEIHIGSTAIGEDNLSIKGFDDDKMIERFRAEKPSVDLMDEKILSNEEVFHDKLNELTSDSGLDLAKLENSNWQEFLANKTLEDLKDILENAILFDSEGPGVDQTMFSVDHNIDFSTAKKLNELLKEWNISDDDMKLPLKKIITDHNFHKISYV